MKCEFAVLAYCMMPDHLHVIAEGMSEAPDGLEFVRLFKQTSGFAWRRHAGGALWQESFYDHVLRSDEQTQHTVRYLLENPVRAKLVASPEDYPYSGSLVYERQALIEWAFAGQL
jgi:putative transposase